MTQTTQAAQAKANQRLRPPVSEWFVAVWAMDRWKASLSLLLGWSAGVSAPGARFCVSGLRETRSVEARSADRLRAGLGDARLVGSSPIGAGPCQAWPRIRSTLAVARREGR